MINVDFIYPIGSIYMNVNSTSPEILFGGKWQQLKARFLCGAGELDTANSSTFYGNTPSGYTIWAGETAGENMHTLTQQEMPSHAHGLTQTYNVPSGAGPGGIALSHANSLSGTTTYTGGGWSHNNMPPYLAVYMWKRIA